jgi:hypothetical protein
MFRLGKRNNEVKKHIKNIDDFLTRRWGCCLAVCIFKLDSENEIQLRSECNLFE